MSAVSEDKAAYQVVHPDGIAAKDAMSQTESAVQLLTRGQVAELLGTTDAKIRRFAETDTTNEYFGGVVGLGKGVRYRAESVPLFADAMTLTPALFRERMMAAIASKAGTNGALSHLGSQSAIQSAMPSPTDSERLIETIRVAFRDSLQSLQVQVVAVAYTDKLLTLKEAREETGLTIAEIRGVPSLQTSERGRRRWRRSELQKLIETIGEKNL